MIERIVDAHQHLWNLSTHVYPWLQAGGTDTGTTGLRRNYLVPDYRADVDGLPLAGSVHVEAAHDPGDPVGETSWLEDQARSTGLPTAIVAYARLEDAGLEDVLDRHLESPRVRGIRQMLNWTPQEPVAERDGLMDDPAWRRGLRALARRDLSFDLQVFPHQLATAADVVAGEPDVMFALNHGGFCQGYTEDRWAVWREGIRRLAGLPNVVVKASGYAAVDPAFQPDRFSAFLGHLFESFGGERVLFASNFPVDGLSTSYRDLFDMYDRALTDASHIERDAFFFGNAVRIYRLDITGED